jgi:hypothetical protein
MASTRRNFVLSLAMSLIVTWLYFGFYPFGAAILPGTEGAALNTLMQIVAIPLTLAIIVGGGLAAASALASPIEDETAREAERRKMALLAPPAVAWIVFMAAMAMVLGRFAQISVVAVSALAILRIAQNMVRLGVLRSLRERPRISSVVAGKPIIGRVRSA